LPRAQAGARQSLRERGGLVLMAVRARPKRMRRGLPRVVVLGGAGAMGRITVRDFAATARGALEVVVADRDLAAARKLPATHVRVDITDAKALGRTLRGAFAVIASL